MSTEERLLQLENSFQTLTRLAVSASERSEQQLAWINHLGTAQAETETKLAALIDAQVRTEDSLSTLAIKLEALTDKVDALVNTQARTDARLDRLVDAQIRTETHLDQTDARLDRLASLVERFIEGQNR